MKSWGYVLVAAVLTAMAFMPVAPDSRQVASVPEVSASTQPLSSLRLEKITPVELPARSPIQAYATAHKPLEGVTIVVDPGHGGQTRWKNLKYTGGTEGVATGQTESDVNLRVSLLLRQYLQAAGAKVLMTRISDDRVTDGEKEAELDARAHMANNNNADLFISVHHNEGPKRDTNYTLVFYPQGMTKAVSLAENIASAVSYHLKTPSLGARSGDYRVLNKVKVPGVIVEASFMSNPTEDMRLSSLAYNKLEAKAIATGILNYIRLTRNRQVDFNTIFSPIDTQAGRAQAIADATFVRKEIVEKRSLFGVVYEEVTYDVAGRVVSSREIGSSRKTKAVASASSKSSSKSTASKSKSTASKSKSSSSKVKITDSKKSSTKSKTATKTTKKKSTASSSSKKKAASS